MRGATGERPHVSRVRGATGGCSVWQASGQPVLQAGEGGPGSVVCGERPDIYSGAGDRVCVELPRAGVCGEASVCGQAWVGSGFKYV